MDTLLPGAMAIGALSVVVAVSGRQSAAPRPDGRAGLDAVLQSAVSRRDVPGVVAMAANRAGVLYIGAAGAAQGDAAHAMKPDAIFRIASMTKPITSTALMQLVEERRLGLDDPVSKYLPAFSKLSVLTSFDARSGQYSVRPATRTLTVRHLLTHTSGLGYGFTSDVVRDFKPKPGDRFEVGPLLFEPGEQWLYGTSLDWVGKLVEKVSGQTLEDYFQQHIFQPLRMTDTSFNEPESKFPRLVDVWQRDTATGTLVAQPRRMPARVTEFNGGGGLSSTAADYVRFVRMILNDGQLDGARILSAESVASMSRNQMGAVSARALHTAQPRLSSDFTFVNDGKDKWGIGFLISTDAAPGLRAPGSLSWGGIDNTYFWIDRTRGVGGVILMQFLPFADSKALATYEAFERGVYQWPPNTR